MNEEAVKWLREQITGTLEYARQIAARRPINPMRSHEMRDLIARCAAELAILDAHAFDTTGKFGSEGPPRCTTCLSDRDGYEEQWEADPWPCQTVRLLASGYRHREGYAEHWPEVNQPAAPSYGYFPPAL